MWIRDYLPRDAPNARILTYGYPSNLQGNTSISTLQDYTTNFVQSLIGMRDSAEVRGVPCVSFMSTIPQKKWNENCADNIPSAKAGGRNTPHLPGALHTNTGDDRPIIFIGHSLGCLIIKKALADIALMGV